MQVPVFTLNSQLCQGQDTTSPTTSPSPSGTYIRSWTPSMYVICPDRTHSLRCTGWSWRTGRGSRRPEPWTNTCIANFRNSLHGIATN